MSVAIAGSGMSGALFVQVLSMKGSKMSIFSISGRIRHADADLALGAMLPPPSPAD